MSPLDDDSELSAGRIAKIRQTASPSKYKPGHKPDVVQYGIMKHGKANTMGIQSCVNLEPIQSNNLEEFEEVHELVTPMLIGRPKQGLGSKQMSLNFGNDSKSMSPVKTFNRGMSNPGLNISVIRPGGVNVGSSMSPVKKRKVTLDSDWDLTC